MVSFEYSLFLQCSADYIPDELCFGNVRVLLDYALKRVIHFNRNWDVPEPWGVVVVFSHITKNVVTNMVFKSFALYKGGDSSSR